jgi:hypothetical protein
MHVTEIGKGLTNFTSLKALMALPLLTTSGCRHVNGPSEIHFRRINKEFKNIRRYVKVHAHTAIRFTLGSSNYSSSDVLGPSATIFVYRWLFCTCNQLVNLFQVVVITILQLNKCQAVWLLQNCGDQLARHTPANIPYWDNSHTKPTGVVKFSNLAEQPAMNGYIYYIC